MAEHTTIINPEQDEDRYRAECSCGWEAERAFSTIQGAEGSADRHKEDEGA